MLNSTMIPSIGIMIGAYIFTKMLSLLSIREEAKGTKVFAVITILVTIFTVIDLLLTGTSIM